jgi:thymidylate synthase (FAD)
MKHKIHTYGFIELVDYMGDDLRIVNAARQSYDKESSKLDEADKGLISYMMKNHHGTPFEHVNFTFKVKAPIFVTREWMRHRIGSFSEMSGRYVELKKEFYIPEEDRVRKQVGKPGDYHFEPAGGPVAWACTETMKMSYKKSWDDYQLMLKMGVAREVARDVLPVGIYTQFMWTVNLRSLFNFIKLRSGEHALSEIRDYSEAIEETLSFVVPVSYAAFAKHGRIVP